MMMQLGSSHLGTTTKLHRELTCQQDTHTSHQATEQSAGARAAKECRSVLHMSNAIELSP